MTEPTLGMRRIRTSFNPSADSAVDEIKADFAVLIDILEGYKLQAKDAANLEAVRLYSLAQTAIEEAAMWAVKGLTA